MFTKVVVGMDGSEGAEKAVPFALDMARRDGAEIVFVHVEEATIGKGGGPMRVDEPEIEAALGRRVKDLRDQGLHVSLVTTTVMLGGAAPAIIKIANEVNADLIIVGSRGHSGLAGILLGSVAHRLVHLSDQAVLVVTPNARPGHPSEDQTAEPASVAG